MCGEREGQRKGEAGRERNRTEGSCPGWALKQIETHGARSDEEDSAGSLGSGLLHVVTWGLGFMGVLLASIRSITVRDGTRRKGLSHCIVVCIDFTSRHESHSGTVPGAH